MGNLYLHCYRIAIDGERTRLYNETVQRRRHRGAAEWIIYEGEDKMENFFETLKNSGKKVLETGLEAGKAMIDFTVNTAEAGFGAVKGLVKKTEAQPAFEESETEQKCAGVNPVLVVAAVLSMVSVALTVAGIILRKGRKR